MTSTVKFKLPAGIKVKDRIQGVEGVITTRCERINGCLQYYIQLPMKEGKQMGFWSDVENLESACCYDGDEVEFMFETGDLVKNRITDISGIVTVRRVDMNKCIHYFYETKQIDRNGKVLEYCSFEQELSLIDKGLNKEDEPEIKRARTGCSNSVPK